MELHLFSGGAAQAVVNGLRPAFEAAQACTLAPTFGAVGAMRDKLLAGDPCDLVILSQALVDGLTGQGHLLADSARPLGRVETGVAVRAGSPPVDIRDGDALGAALRACTGLYVPHLTQSTAGIHIAGVLEKLGLTSVLADRIHEYPNGNAAMAAMAKADGHGLIGCTQVTEIRYTPGVSLVGNLPSGYGLSTIYTAAVCTHAAEPALAGAFVRVLSEPASASLRKASGFDI
ncbi:molybdate ABC transporter substrate-binding protein [Achromobacter aloeverae]|uniref:Molybdate ABC transporter substrate-binding protein n=1 Tax=Achromobacter aloeverae TaxID=1750518 RepID=A0A4Q1HIL9_9BURK|nr:substrate-binding domain-containing protein [Achromobacter aloeverae]RXN87921.1 molybdate ABC transporter substrate-binding protein [Achromobacter aloeverae]